MYKWPGTDDAKTQNLCDALRQQPTAFCQPDVNVNKRSRKEEKIVDDAAISIRCYTGLLCTGTQIGLFHYNRTPQQGGWTFKCKTNFFVSRCSVLLPPDLVISCRAQKCLHHMEMFSM